jgi:hypothetical protein
MQTYHRIALKKKGKKTLVKLNYSQAEANKEGNSFDVKWTKESNQYLSKELDYAIESLKPHLMFASELIDESIKLNVDMDYQTWFADHHFNDDERFDNLTITQIDFIGTEALDAVKIYGYKSTTKTDKEFKVKIETPVINLDRSENNRYALASIIDTQIDTLQHEIEEWLKGKTLSKIQQMAMFEEQEEAA